VSCVQRAAGIATTIRAALDTSAVGSHSSGIGRYVTQLVLALRRAGVAVVAGPELSLSRAPHGEARTGLAGSALTAANELLYERVRLPGVVRRAGVDLYHATAARLPGRRLSVPIVVTIHDFAAFEFPSWQGTLRGFNLRSQIRRAVSRADLIVVPSVTIRQELERRFPSAASRAVTIAHGVASVFHRTPRTDEGAAATTTFVSVATLERRKNLTTLLDAFARVLAIHPGARLRLIGQDQNAASAIQQRLDRLQIRQAVTTEGYVSDEQLAGAYAGALATVYPSVYEGFGLPIIESMASGTPVITSDRGAMREVAGGAALLVDPQDPDSIAAEMRRLAEDGRLRERLQSAGRERALAFTWDACARRHLEAYGSLGDRSARRDRSRLVATAP